MLSERLRAVVERMEQLPQQEQDELATSIQATLDEEGRWNAALAQPEDLLLDRLLNEAREQVARGEARDLDELL